MSFAFWTVPVCMWVCVCVCTCVYVCGYIFACIYWEKGLLMHLSTSVIVHIFTTNSDSWTNTIDTWCSRENISVWIKLELSDCVTATITKHCDSDGSHCNDNVSQSVQVSLWICLPAVCTRKIATVRISPSNKNFFHNKIIIKIMIIQLASREVHNHSALDQRCHKALHCNCLVLQPECILCGLMKSWPGLDLGRLFATSQLWYNLRFYPCTTAAVTTLESIKHLI